MSLSKSPYWKLFWSSVFHSLIGGCGWFDYTALNLLEPFVKRFINQSLTSHYDYTPTEDSLAWYWSSLTMIWLIGNIPGSLMLTYFCEKFGRRNTVTVLKNVTHIFSSFLQFWAARNNSIEMLFIGRFLAGFPGAMAFFVPVFIAECCPTEHRGLVSSIPGLGLQFWCVLAMGLGLPQFLGTEDSWPLVLLFPVFPSFLHLISTPLFCESPKHLFITKQNDRMARKSIKFYHGPEAKIDEVLAEFQMEKDLAESQESVTYRQIFKTRHLLWPFLICNVASCTIAFDGNLVVNQYSVESMVGVSLVDAKILSVFIVHIPAIAVSLATLLLVEKTGRRCLFLWGTGICVIAEFLLLMSGPMQNTSEGLSAFLSVSGMILVMLGDSLGPSIIRTFLPGELCPQISRSQTTATQFALENFCATVATFYYPPANEKYGTWAIFPLLVVTLGIFIYLYKYLPETKNKTVSEVVQRWTEFEYENQPLLNAETDWVYM